MRFFFKKHPAILFGLLFSFVGLGVGLYIELTAVANYSFFSVVAFIAGFATGSFFSFIFKRKKSELKNSHIVWIGLLTGIVSHYICWYFLFITYNVCHFVSGKCTSSLGEEPANLFLAFAGALPLTFFSLLFYGWVTVILGILFSFLTYKITQNTLVKKT